LNEDRQGEIWCVAGGVPVNEVFLSTDAGESWSAANFPDSVDLRYGEVAISSTIGKVYVGGDKGLYVTDAMVSVEETAPSELSLDLMQNYPNPFNSSTVIPFVLSRSTTVEIKIFDLGGREVVSVFRGFLPPGTHHVQVHASKFSTGVYIYRLRTPTTTLLINPSGTLR
jgi:hypothetical protein